MAGTRPRSIKTVKGDIPRIIHDIDQFRWYRDAKERSLGDEIKEEDALSAVRFLLPHADGIESNPYVIAVGNGFDICNVYIARVNWGMSSGTGNTPKETSGLWRVFSYHEKREFLKDDSSLRKLREKLPSKLGEIFTTDVAPFLRNARYPGECDRIYDFELNGGDKLIMIARSRENREEENFQIMYVPDFRDRDKEKLITLQHGSWTDPKVVEPLPFTDRFSFSSDVNSHGL